MERGINLKRSNAAAIGLFPRKAQSQNYYDNMRLPPSKRQPWAGRRVAGPDGHVDDPNWVAASADLGCSLSPRCTTCEMVRCVEEFSASVPAGHGAYKLAVAHHRDSGGVLTEAMKVWLPNLIEVHDD